MTRPQLRIYYGPRDHDGTAGLGEQPDVGRVSMPLREVFPILADAMLGERSWLNDFADDEIAISTDLYEVILAYQHYRRPSA